MKTRTFLGKFPIFLEADKVSSGALYKKLVSRSPVENWGEIQGLQRPTVNDYN